MPLFISMIIMTGIAATILAIPFLRAGGGWSGGGNAAIANARQQLASLQKEAAAGMIEQSEVALARREIEARVLAAAKEGETEVKNGSDKIRLLGLATVVALVTIGSAVLYGIVGSPRMPGAQMPATPLPVATLNNSSPNISGNATTGQPVASVDTMIANLAARLEDDPEDAEGWRMLGWSYFQTENYLGAVEAYSRAVALDATDPIILSVYGEAVVRSEDGQVSDRALGIFHQALALDPVDPRARFFQGMALEQRGDPHGAVTLWLEILDSAPADADWAPGLRDRIAELAPAAGIDLTKEPAWGQSEVATNDTFRGPSASDIAAAQQMNQDDRQAMIQGMVDGLAARLEDDPNDIEGWARLIRSYTVMNDAKAAKDALERAAQLLGRDSAAFGVIELSANELGVR